MANYLTKLRTDPKYFRVKAHMETALERIPAVGTALVEVLQEGKKIIRRGIYHSTMFEEMGFQYVGPVDGHDVTELTRIFTNLQEQYSPVFLHIVTQKGKGLKPAEENPGEFHSVSAFDLDHLTNPEMSPKDSFSNRFGNKLAALGREVPNLCAITAAMKYGTGLNFFYHAIPERFFDVGMAEEHAVTFAAGLASQGMLPVVAIYSTFFQRAYDQMIHDERMNIINRLVNELPEKQRLIMQLRDIEGESYKKIAGLLNLTEEQVKVNLFRARQKVKQRYLEIDEYGL